MTPLADSRWLYTGLVALVAVARAIELALSRGHERRLRRRGAVEAGAGHYPVMVALHAAFLAACPCEVWAFSRPFLPALGAPMLGLLAGAWGLRWWTMATLGERWTTRVLVLPGLPVATTGPYRFVRHPNYLAVVVELAALPLVHAAWATAALFGAANAGLLALRIRAEEGALAAHGAYRERLAGRGALLPRWPGRTR